MKKSYSAVAGIVAAAGLSLAVATAYADPQGKRDGTGPHATGGMQHGTAGATGHGARGHGAMGSGTMGSGAMGHGAMGSGTMGPGAGHEALTAEERTAFIEKMRSAQTPEERQKIAATMRAEMQQRHQATGAALPERRGPGAGTGNTTDSK